LDWRGFHNTNCGALDGKSNNCLPNSHRAAFFAGWPDIKPKNLNGSSFGGLILSWFWLRSFAAQMHGSLICFVLFSGVATM
jgi:hypothetical protein